MLVAQSPIEPALFIFSFKEHGEVGFADELWENLLPVGPYLIKIDMNFSPIWKVSLAVDHAIYSDGVPYAISPDYQGGATIAVLDAESAYEEEDIFYLLSFDENGEQANFATKTRQDDFWGINTFLIDKKGDLIIGNFTSVFKFSPNFDLLWEYKFPSERGHVDEILLTEDNEYMSCRKIRRKVTFFGRKHLSLSCNQATGNLTQQNRSGKNRPLKFFCKNLLLKRVLLGAVFVPKETKFE